MAIRYEHVHRPEVKKSFIFLGCSGNVWSLPKAPFISYSRILDCMSKIKLLSLFLVKLANAQHKI